MSNIINKTLFNRKLIYTIIKTKYNIIRTISSTTNTKCDVGKASSSANNNNTGEESQYYDVIIVGGAATGLSMACSMAKNTMLADRKILLLDGLPTFKGYKQDGFSNRVFALNKGAIDLLKSIDAWNTITAIRYKPVKQLQVWDACSDALITFNHDNFSDDVAYIVENDVLTYAILEEIKKMNNITMLNNVKITDIQLPKNNDVMEHGQVTLNNGKQYNCELLIGADGANSIVRKQMGYDNFQLSYNQMGVIATVELNETDSNSVAWQRFLPNGVIALLPLSDNLSSIVWSTNTKHAKSLLQLPKQDFIDAVNDAFWKIYPKNQFISNALQSIESILGNHSQTVKQLPPNIKDIVDDSRAAFPLNLGHTSTYVSNGVALIGDSAHRVHPMAGQGLNLGFGDVQCLSNILANASYSGFKLGHIQHLLKYERQRLQHNVPVMLGIHSLHRLYNTDFSPIVLLRSVGLQLTQSINPLKKFFMEKAMV